MRGVLPLPQLRACRCHDAEIAARTSARSTATKEVACSGVYDVLVDLFMS